MQSNALHASWCLDRRLRLSGLTPIATTCFEFAFDVRKEIEIASACKDTQPQCQLRRVDHHALDVQRRLEEDRYKREQVSAGVNGYEYE